MLACLGCALLDRLKIDDPVGCVPTHGFAGIWGLIAVSLFAEVDTLGNRFSNDHGVFKGGPWKLLGVQLVLIVSVGSWAAVMTFLELFLVDKVFPLRMSLEDEMIGADKTEHGIDQCDPSRTDEELEHHTGEPETEAGNDRSSEEVNGRNVFVSRLSLRSAPNSNNVHFQPSNTNQRKRAIFRREFPSFGLKRKTVSLQGQSTSTNTGENKRENGRFFYNVGVENNGRVHSMEDLNRSDLGRLEMRPCDEEEAPKI